VTKRSLALQEALADADYPLREAILQVSCPVCGACSRATCSGGKHHPERIHQFQRDVLARYLAN
jgi:hypothetical protein